MSMILKGNDLSIDKTRLELLNSLIDSFIEKEYKQFFIVRAHRFGVPIYEYTAGKSSKPYGLQQDSITPVFSCTKPITSVLIMKLQEDGLLDVCDSVSDYLTWIGEGKKDILIWHLLTHTSGIIDDDFFKFSKEYCKNELGIDSASYGDSHEEWDKYHSNVKEKANLSKDANRTDVDRYFLERFTPTKKPREIMSYGMTAFNLLGDIITSITGKNINDYAKEVLFDPIGMNDSYFIVPKEKYDRVIGRTEKAQGYPWINSEDCMNNICAQNGLKTTVKDLCRFADMILSEGQIDGVNILSHASIREMSDNHNFDLPNVWDSWSLGWNLRGKKKDDAGVLRSAISLEHGGWAGSKILCDPQYGLSVAIFSGEYKESEKSGINNIINVIYSALR